MDASSPQFGNAIAHIKTAIASGLNYNQAVRVNFLLTQYACNKKTGLKQFNHHT